LSNTKESKIMANQIYIVYPEICILLINSLSPLQKCNWEPIPIYIYQRKIVLQNRMICSPVNNSLQGEPSWQDSRTWCPASMSTTSMYGEWEASSSRMCGVVDILAGHHVLECAAWWRRRSSMRERSQWWSTRLPFHQTQVNRSLWVQERDLVWDAINFCRDKIL
jgi:hypothetical protein